MRQFVHEVGWYGFASLCALCIDFGLFLILVKFLAANFLSAATQSFICRSTVAYALSISMVFRYHRLDDRRAEIAGFVALRLPGLALNAGVISALVKYFGVNYLCDKCAAAFTTFSYNFFARRHLVCQRK